MRSHFRPSLPSRNLLTAGAAVALLSTSAVVIRSAASSRAAGPGSPPLQLVNGPVPAGAGAMEETTSASAEFTASAEFSAPAEATEATETFEITGSVDGLESGTLAAGAVLASLKTQGSRVIRVGLTTKGGDITLMAPDSVFVSDADQAGRRLTVPAGQPVTFRHGPERTLAARGVTFKGAVEIRVGTKTFGAWSRPVANVAGGPTRVTSSDESVRWSRPYRGSFEISPQTYSFEPAKHKSALRLVNLVPIEEYLKGVVPWEMNPTAPIEALKAQAICARGETLAKIQNGRHKADGFEVCDYDHCQGYPGVENEKPASSLAVEQTVGLVLMRDGHIADAVYGTNSGGITADKNDVWRGGPAPHLQSVRDFDPKKHPVTARAVKARMSEADWVHYCTTNLPSFAQPDAAEVRALAARRRKSPRTAALFQKDDLPEFYRWRREFSLADIAAAASLKSPVPFATVEKIEVLDRAASGHIKKLDVVGRAADGSPLRASYEKDGAIRSLLSGRLGSTTALPSSTFVVLPKLNKGALTGFAFAGAGWGHGAGMCQRGAQNHAKSGWTARQILQWYYNGVQVQMVK